MDRTLVYAGQVPRALDNLLLGRFAMVGLAKLSEAVLGTGTVVSQGGFGVTPAGGLNISVAPGQVYQLQSIEPVTESALNVDGHQVLKQGLALDAQTLTLAPPTANGYAQNFLIQVAYQDISTGQTVLSFQNPTPVLDPSTGAYKYVTYPGPGGNGAQSYTILQGGVSVSAKAGTAAPSGSQNTPAPDTGFVGVAVVTLAYGASTISSGNIAAYSGAPTLPVTLPGIPTAVQANTWSYAVGSGTNAITASLTPTPPVLLDGLSIVLYCPNANTGPVTLALNNFAPSPVVRRDGAALQAADITAQSIVRLTYKAGVWGFVSPAPSEIKSTAITIINALKLAGGTPQQWSSPGTYYLILGPNLTFAVTECRGGGGGGGGANSTSAAGSGGGGGGSSTKVATTVTSVTLQIIVGVGGTGGAGGGGVSNGTAGGTTVVSVSAGSVTDFAGNVYGPGATLCAASGGGFGYGSSSGPQQTSAGTPGMGTGGDSNISGDPGGFPYLAGPFIGGVGGGSPGSGGQPQVNYGNPGNSTTAAGVGGNGSSSNGAGGNGAPGRVTIQHP